MQERTEQWAHPTLSQRQQLNCGKWPWPIMAFKPSLSIKHKSNTTDFSSEVPSQVEA